MRVCDLCRAQVNQRSSTGRVCRRRSSCDQSSTVPKETRVAGRYVGLADTACTCNVVVDGIPRVRQVIVEHLSLTSLKNVFWLIVCLCASCKLVIKEWHTAPDVGWFGASCNRRLDGACGLPGSLLVHDAVVEVSQGLPSWTCSRMVSTS